MPRQKEVFIRGDDVLFYKSVRNRRAAAFSYYIVKTGVASLREDAPLAAIRPSSFPSETLKQLPMKLVAEY